MSEEGGPPDTGAIDALLERIETEWGKAIATQVLARYQAARRHDNTDPRFLSELQEMAATGKVPRDWGEAE